MHLHFNCFIRLDSHQQEDKLDQRILDDLSLSDIVEQRSEDDNTGFASSLELMRNTIGPNDESVQLYIWY